MADRTIQGSSKSLLDTMPTTTGAILGYQTSGNWTSSKSFRLTASRQLPPNTSIEEDLRKLIAITRGRFVRSRKQIVIFLKRELKYGATDSRSREANSEEASQSRKRLLTPCTSFTMLKEMTVLVIVLWGSQGMPTTRSPEQNLSRLIELYCKAEKLLQDYKSVDKKILPPQSRPVMASDFSQPGCNFTKAEEECQILRAFNALFLWLESTYPQEGLLKSVRNSFTLLIKLQKSHISQTCSEEASADEVPEITCRKYTSNMPKLENNFHYIFELYRNHTHNLWHSKLPEQQRNVTDVCGATD